MNPIETLRRGILAGDWAEVCHGFSLLTGEKLEPSAQSDGTWRESALRIAQSLVSVLSKTNHIEEEEEEKEEEEKEEEEEEEEEEEKPVVVPPKARGKKSSKKNLQKIDEESQPVLSMEERFRVVHNKPKSENGEACRLVPHEPPKGKNKFTPKKTDAANDIADSISLSKKKAPEPRRKKSQLVKVSCLKCGEKDKVPRALAPRAPAVDGDKTAGTVHYVCVKCLRREMI